MSGEEYLQAINVATSHAMYRLSQLVLQMNSRSGARGRGWLMRRSPFCVTRGEVASSGPAPLESHSGIARMADY
jgi:hypothetical protein